MASITPMDDPQMELSSIGTRGRHESLSRTSIVYNEPYLSPSAVLQLATPSDDANLSDSAPMISGDHEDIAHSISSVVEGTSMNRTNDDVIDDLKFGALQSGDGGKTSQCRFEWHSVNVFVGRGSAAKQILHDQHGSVRSGQLLAVMGGSGAGKSTLLDALSGRSNLHQLEIEGDLAINGMKFKVKKQRLIQSLCAFVPQNDILCPTQTVEEALWFYARLKLHSKSRQELKARIDHLVDVLHLSECRHSRIGDEHKRGISGGEKRRVSIAVEILNDADIIFLDEPTSGLDAYTAARTIKTLKHFCSTSNKMIICTIHQPSVEVFYLFDHLLVLGAGKCAFNGGINAIDEYFKESLRPKANPADVIVFEVQRRSDHFVSKWNDSEINPRRTESARTRIDEEVWKSQYEPLRRRTFDDDTVEMVHYRSEMAPFWIQLGWTTAREFKDMVRRRKLSATRFLQILLFALITGFMYFRVEQGFERKINCYIFIVFSTVLFGLISMVAVFPSKRILFQREFWSGTYGVGAWTLSFMTIEFPREMAHTAAYSGVVLLLTQLDGTFVELWITAFLSTFSGGSVGVLIGAITRSATEASLIIPGAVLPMLMFSDSYLDRDSMPVYIAWICDINPMYYILRCLYIIEFQDASWDRHIPQKMTLICKTYKKYIDGVLNIPLFESFFSGNFDSLSTLQAVEAMNCSEAVSEAVDHYNVEDFNLSQSVVEHLNLSRYLNDSRDYTADDLYDYLNQSQLESLLDDYYQHLYVQTPAPGNGSDVDSFSTTMSPQQEMMELLCIEEITGEFLFEEKSIEPESLYLMWVLIALISVAVRVCAVGSVLAREYHWMSWIKKEVRQRVCGE